MSKSREFEKESLSQKLSSLISSKKRSEDDLAIDNNGDIGSTKDFEEDDILETVDLHPTRILRSDSVGGLSRQSQEEEESQMI